jgi:hypothetical protein
MINASNKLESENWKSENTFFANYVNWFWCTQFRIRKAQW